MASYPYNAIPGVKPKVAVAPSNPNPSSVAGRPDPRFGRSPGVAGPRLQVSPTVTIMEGGDDPMDTAGALVEATVPMQSDCAWCRYGKPAVAGALVGAAVTGLAMGGDWSKGGLWGALAGVAYGQFFRG